MSLVTPQLLWRLFNECCHKCSCYARSTSGLQELISTLNAHGHPVYFSFATTTTILSFNEIFLWNDFYKYISKLVTNKPIIQHFIKFKNKLSSYWSVVLVQWSHVVIYTLRLTNTAEQCCYCQKKSLLNVDSSSLLILHFPSSAKGTILAAGN